jgi:hypothetical protein
MEFGLGRMSATLCLAGAGDLPFPLPLPHPVPLPAGWRQGLPGCRQWHKALPGGVKGQLVPEIRCYPTGKGQ